MTEKPDGKQWGWRALIFVALVVMYALVAASTWGADWRMGGRATDRNPVSPEQNPPTDWRIEGENGPARNIRWSARVGRWAIGGPVVANGLVWVGTNNEPPLDPAVTGDRGVLACFRESDGKFLYHYTSPRLELGRWIADWPTQGLSGSPVTEGDKLWFITNRRNVVCLSTSPLSRGEGPARELWNYDLVKEQGVFPNSPHIPGHNNVGSPTIWKDLLFVPTGNGVDVDHPGATRVRAPDAPSLVCMRKESGKVVWKDNSPGKDIYGGHHASPLVVEVGGKVQVIHPQGDGWVRSFDAWTGKLVWFFDTNHKDAKWDWTDRSGHAKHVVVATPVYSEGRVYFAAGREPEFVGSKGRLFCIDPTKTGDISPELDDGRQAKPNPNSRLVWDFTNDAKAGADESNVLSQTIASVAIHKGLVVIPDRFGRVHCLDAKTGKRYWTHATDSSYHGDPLIVDDKIFVANEVGTVTILALSKSLNVIAKHELDRPVDASPVFANSTLFVLTREILYAIGAKR